MIDKARPFQGVAAHFWRKLEALWEARLNVAQRTDEQALLFEQAIESAVEATRKLWVGPRKFTPDDCVEIAALMSELPATTTTLPSEESGNAGHPSQGGQSLSERSEKAQVVGGSDIRHYWEKWKAEKYPDWRLESANTMANFHWYEFAEWYKTARVREVLEEACRIVESLSEAVHYGDADCEDIKLALRTRFEKEMRK